MGLQCTKGKYLGGFHRAGGFHSIWAGFWLAAGQWESYLDPEIRKLGFWGQGSGQGGAGISGTRALDEGVEEPPWTPSRRQFITASTTRQGPNSTGEAPPSLKKHLLTHAGGGREA